MVYLKPLDDSTPARPKYSLTAPEQAVSKPSLLSYRRHPSQAFGSPELTIDDRFATRLAFDSASSALMGLDDLLKANERAAANAFIKTIRPIPAPALPAQFARNLGETILPRLSEIGMNARLARELFRLAGPAWQSMSPCLDKNIIFHPKIYLEIDSIRAGIRRQAEEASEKEFQPQTTISDEQIQNINRSMAPENLQGLLDQITTPWIILPRAYNGLQKNQNYYLPIYLQFIDKNGHVACNRVFTRIVIELVANYCAKFSDRSYAPVLLKNALFHAYEAMFWKTLRCPPQGFEDCRIFETLLHFLVRHAGKGHPSSTPMAKAIVRMQAAQAHIFPQFLHADHQLKPSRFLITLRHGAPEIGTLLRYFEHKLKMDRNAQSHRCNPMALQKATTGLIREVGKKYHQENQSTQHNVRQFFRSLRRVVADNSPSRRGTAVSRLDPVRFSARRIVKMIDKLLLEFS